MDHPLRYAFPIEVRHLLLKPTILQKHRTPGTHCQRIGVVPNGLSPKCCDFSRLSTYAWIELWFEWKDENNFKPFGSRCSSYIERAVVRPDLCLGHNWPLDSAHRQQPSPQSFPLSTSSLLLTSLLLFPLFSQIINYLKIQMNLNWFYQAFKLLYLANKPWMVQPFTRVAQNFDCKKMYMFCFQIIEHVRCIRKVFKLRFSTNIFFEQAKRKKSPGFYFLKFCEKFYLFNWNKC